VAKKRVGGSCLSSPTTTSCRLRATAPSASTGRTWLASSISIKSKDKPSSPSRSKNCATLIGLIMNTGLTAWIACPASLSSRRSGRWLRFF